jgi:hypothetical protein
MAKMYSRAESLTSSKNVSAFSISTYFFFSNTRSITDNILGFFGIFSTLSPFDLNVSSFTSIYEPFFFFDIFLISEAISFPFFFVLVLVLLIELIKEEQAFPPPAFVGCIPSSYYEIISPLNYFFINLINDESA